MKRLTKIAMNNKIYLIGMAIVSMFLALTVVIQNIAIAKVLNEVLINKHFQIYGLISLTGVILLLRATFNMLNLNIGNRMASKVAQYFRQQAIDKNSKAPIGSQLNVVTEIIDGILPFFNSYFPQVFKSMMIPLFIIVAMFFIHLNTALIMLVTAPFIPLFYIIFGLKTRDEAKDKMTYLNQFSQQFLNKVKGLVTLKLFNRTTQTEREIYEESTHFRTLTMIILRSAFLSGLMLEFITMLGIGLVALEVGLGLVLFHNINFETAAIAIILAPEFYNAIKDLGQSFHTGKQSEGSSDVLFDFLDSAEPKVIAQPQVISSNNMLSLQNIWFKYNDAANYVLQNIHLKIKRGDKIALVGPSGAGKSTLAKIISQQLQPSSGAMYMNETAINFGVLSQQPYIFNTSIRNNITMFDDTVADEVINNVLTEVNLQSKIRQLNDGIDTHIGEGGEMLSGGEMRRIELARVLLLQPDVVIFDEPTTGLDIRTEKIIQAAIERHFQQQTIIFIAHRNSTIRQADIVIELNKGKIQNIDGLTSAVKLKGDDLQ
ncbi:ABC transporter ATP-binding protein/permease [Staphylococcus lloydii]|uniref:ABC transporter ATP-binding protein/permease n=1 Tax=Staphylococcus lloydii TaxID=2781774 RepID=UPI002927B8C1|nr:ABC transporter ATP-binding protein/permease [Staphylococcus lloydii]MDU9417085.1 ABC transporter ATP-binding protein/permease [Staphylococcus lloydii]